MKGEQPLCNVHLQADAAHQITNGFEQVFGSDFKRAMCWFHVTEKIKPRLQLLKDDQLRDQILTDIHELQRCQSQPIFHAATKLFQDKYKDKGDRVTDFLEYFKSEWLVQQPNWYEGYLGTLGPSTNNGLESLNGYIIY